MIPEEEILNTIHEMGYITVKARAIFPSYYKLSDGTILKAHVNVHALIADPRSPDKISLNSINEVVAYIPKQKRRPEAYQQYEPTELAANIIDDDVEFEVLREEFSVYDLSNNMILSIKTVVGQVRKTKYLTVHGESVYTVNINPVIKFKKN